MNKHQIKHIGNTRIEFNTLSKTKIIDVFNYKCKSLYQLKEDDLVIIQDKMCLPIDLSQWKDIDTNTDFLNVLEALKRITNPKSGNPVLVIASKLVGFDTDTQLHFIFHDDFVKGVHSIIGQYENGVNLLYTDNLYIL